MKKLKRFGTIVLFIMALVILHITPVYAVKVATGPSTSAQSYTNVQKKIVAVYYPKKDKKNVYVIANTSGTITNLKCSNKTVLSVSKKKSGSDAWISGTVKKAGTATVTFKINGKKYTTKVVVKKYVCPVKSIKIGSTVLKSTKYKNSSICTLSASKYLGKKQYLSVIPAKGWKISGTYPFYQIFYFFNGFQGGYISNNASFRAAKGDPAYVRVILRNTKTGQEESVDVVFK